MRPNRKPQGHPVGAFAPRGTAGQDTGGSLAGHIAMTLSDFFERTSRGS